MRCASGPKPWHRQNAPGVLVGRRIVHGPVSNQEMLFITKKIDGCPKIFNSGACHRQAITDSIHGGSAWIRFMRVDYAACINLLSGNMKTISFCRMAGLCVFTDRDGARSHQSPQSENPQCVQIL
jgi:hypothetical protein